VQFGYLSRPYFDGTLLNISETGLAVKADNPIPENTDVTIIIYYLNRPIELEGRVKRVTQCYFSNEYEMGIILTCNNVEYNSIYHSMLKRNI
jgi:hypothetical protein